MSAVNQKHGFEHVDDEPDPKAWVDVLDRLHAEPFYREYKARVRELLAPERSGRYLEVGAGVGTDAAALGASVVGVDRSLTMCREARSRGLPVLVGAAEALPLSSNSVDGCWADRTFQHLAHPEKALRELIRVTKPGGRVVVVDPDYGTQVVEHPDQRLAQKVLDFRAHQMLRNGTLAHRMAGMFIEASLEHVAVEEKTVVVRDPASLDNVLGLRSWALTASRAGFMTNDEVARWETLYDQVVAKGSFLWSVTFFTTSGNKVAA